MGSKSATKVEAILEEGNESEQNEALAQTQGQNLQFMMNEDTKKQTNMFKTTDNRMQELDVTGDENGEEDE